MVNLLETLYGLTVLAAVVAIIAAVQSRGALPDRVERYRKRMRWSASLALVLGLVSACLYWYLSVE